MLKDICHRAALERAGAPAAPAAAAAEAGDGAARPVPML
jgi:hypothetical protein